MSKSQREPLKVRTTVRSLIVEYEGDDPAAAAQILVSIARNLGLIPKPTADEGGTP